MKIRIFGLVSVVAVLSAAALLWFSLDDSQPADESVKVDKEAGTDSASKGIGEVGSRAVDPATPPGTWAAQGEDLSELAKLAENAEKTNGLLQSEYDMYAELDGWVEGYATDDEFGDAAVACRIKHEPKITEKCKWGYRHVIKRENEGEARVVYTAIRQKETAAPECKAWAACMHKAWQDRPAPVPQGFADQDYYSVRSGAGHQHIHEDDPAAYKAAYVDRVADLEDVIARETTRFEAGPPETDDGGNPLTEDMKALWYAAMKHQINFKSAHLADAKRVLRALH